jgi:predicted nuclease with TOPRIM domain
MTTKEPTSSQVNPAQELEELRTKSASLEQQQAKLMKLIDANSNYRNDIIWLAGEINKVQKRIKELEGQVK